MKANVNVVFCIQILVIAYGNAKILPDSVASLMCPRSSSNYEKCLLKSFEKSRSFIKHGIKELDVPPLDPLKIPYLSLTYSLEQIVDVSAALSNVEIIGLANIIFDNVTADLDATVGELWVTIPHLQVSLEYDIQGSMVDVPFDYKGLFKGHFYDIKHYGTGHFKMVETNGVEYFNMDSFNNTINIKDAEVKLTAASPEFQYTATLVEKYFNANAQSLLGYTMEMFGSYGAELFRSRINEQLAKFPAKELLPE